MHTDRLLSWEREFMSLFLSHEHVVHILTPTLFILCAMFSIIIIIFSSGNMTVTSGMLFTRTSRYLFFTIPTEMASTILLIHFLNV